MTARSAPFSAGTSGGTVSNVPAASGDPERRENMVAAAGARVRSAPTPGRLARRRILITATKLLLPICALALLASIAIWPELDRESESARMAFRRMAGEVEGARLLDARYRGVDEKSRPYTVTASVAQQMDPNRINLTNPKGDITLENGRWMMVQSKKGVYMQHASQLDLSQDVTLYRDDGLTVTTATASLDLKDGAASSSDPTHAEGPFGVLDAQGFTVLDKGATIQFAGQSHVVLNAANGTAQ